MPELFKELAALICHSDAVLNPRKWLAEEASNLATRIAHLDEIPPQAILPLAKLVADGESDARQLALALDIDEVKLDEYLEALCEFEFAEWTGNGHKATPAGEEAFKAVGERMVQRELFQVKGRLQQLEQLRRHLNGS
jgi:hypothetical protein